MDFEEIIELLLDEFKQRRIEVISDINFPLEAITCTKKRIMIFNSFLITPYKLCHELMHVKNKDKKRAGTCDTTHPHEVRANKGAILYLWQLFSENGGKFSDFPSFIEATGCPEDFARLTILKATTKEYAINEVEEKVTDYLYTTDEEPETWNLYRIMDALHINRQWELLVAALIAKIGYNLMN